MTFLDDQALSENKVLSGGRGVEYAKSVAKHLEERNFGSLCLEGSQYFFQIHIAETMKRYEEVGVKLEVLY